MHVGVRVIVWTNCTMEKKDLNSIPKPVVFEGDKTPNKARCKLLCVQIYSYCRHSLYRIISFSTIDLVLEKITYIIISILIFLITILVKPPLHNRDFFRDDKTCSSHNCYSDSHLRTSRLRNQYVIAFTCHRDGT